MRAHVVVVGAGGLGCPAAWALAEAGVGRITVIDPDVVEPSNLPRQVLYGEADVGRSKALVAAERLERFGGRVEGHAERLDHTNEVALLEGADVLVDATDGAPTKDWLNALAVRRALPLVHAAALRSEGRLLEVPAGGRPCLACVFGRLGDDPGGTCADLGVWGGVVGATGFLAADAALWRIEDPEGTSPGYVVLDVEGGRALTLAAEANARCPVCGDGGPRVAEPYPVSAACDASPGDAPTPAPATTHALLDLGGESCPLNLLRARREVEALQPGATLEIRLGAEGAASVPDGLRALGHELLEETPRGNGTRLLVRRRSGAGSAVPLDRDDLIRFARQVVLPEVGEAGQRRLGAAAVEVAGDGATAETAAIYLRAAGVGRVTPVAEADGSAVRILDIGGKSVALGIQADAAGRAGVVRLPGDARPAPTLPLPVQRALGALLADAACRTVVAGDASLDPPAIVLGAGGTIDSRTPSRAGS